MAGALSCRLLFEDREISLRPGENLLGRVDEGGQATLEDLGSKNGTFWRGQRISTPLLLSDGDEIRLGKVPLTLRILPVDTTTLTDQVDPAEALERRSTTGAWKDGKDHDPGGPARRPVALGTASHCR